MKVKILIPLLAVLLSGTAVVAEAAGPRGNSGEPRGPGRQIVVQAPLSAEEASHLAAMREEEKLARDIYSELADRWQAVEFRNIGSSEQKHFDAIGANLVKFGLSDPALSAAGRFSSAEVQNLYDTLLASGSTSYIDALQVGATIEDMDIRDLLAAIEVTANPTLKRTYDSLLQGSKNHLRAFVSRLAEQGADYQPKYIDDVLFDAIVGH
jgi:hypothetical protein